MRIKNLLGMAAILALTASCSENELVESTGKSEIGTSYASFNIVLPTTNSTRATNAPTYEDGDENEYKVNDGTILVFQKTGEEFVFIESASLNLNTWTTSTENGITTEGSVTAKLNNVSQTGTAEYYALVLLNNGNGAVALPTSGTYSAWNNTAQNKLVSNFTGTNKDNFLMSNAALNSGVEKGVLVKIDKSKIAATKEAATEAAATIHVQRAVAKVTAKVNGTTNTIQVTGSTTEAVEFTNWALDVTNKKTFPVQNISTLSDDIWNYAYSGTNYTKGWQGRLFWAIDPNYDNNLLFATGSEGESARNANFNYISTANVTNTMGSNDYCLENTFNLDNMKQGETTRVVFKANYKVNNVVATFYMIGNNTEILSEDNLKNKIQGVAQTIFNETGTSDNITIDLGDIKTTAGSKHMVTAANIKVDDNTLGESTEYGTDASKKKTGAQIVQAVNDALGLNAETGISTYLDGVTYYIARIKHFGDTYTPWNSGEVYGDANGKYLGRYGVLRNNWYELAVNSVSGPGYPTVPPVKPEISDDESDKYIKCTIKILDWAKRSQSVDL